MTQDFGLDLVFHPHVSTYEETMEETEQFFDVTSATGIGLCLDTGHCAYARGDSAKEEKYRDILRFVHIKDVNESVLAEVRRKELNFEQAIELEIDRFRIVPLTMRIGGLNGDGLCECDAFIRRSRTHEQPCLPSNAGETHR